MGRPERHDVDYFPFYAKDGRTLFILETKYQSKGTGFFTNVLRFLALQPDHHFSIEAPADMLYFFSKTKCDEESGVDMLWMMATTGKIDMDLFEEHRVIASQALLNSIEDAYRKRSNNIIHMDQIRAFFDKDSDSSHDNWRPEYKDWALSPEERRRREGARRELANALKKGILKRMPCAICGSAVSEGHHRDYSKPLEVEWLCRSHHNIAAKEPAIVPDTSAGMDDTGGGQQEVSGIRTQRKGKERKVKDSKGKNTKEDISSEPQEPSEPPIIEMPLISKNGEPPKTYPIYQIDIDDWTDAYPSLDILSRLKAIRQWSISNPLKKKTPKGIRKHITTWLEKDHNSGKFKKDELAKQYQPPLEDLNKDD